MVKLFLELALYTPALLVLKGIMDNDDQDVEAWYLEGWCFYLMSEQAKEGGGSLDEMTWEELAKDSRDCLDTCVVVSHLIIDHARGMSNVLYVLQLHTNQEHPDEPLLNHAKELISKLEALGIQPSPVEEEEPEGEVEWEDVDSEDEDVEMT